MENKVDYWLEAIKSNDKYYWENDDNSEACGYASTEEEIIKEVKKYIEQDNDEVDSISIYKKIYVAIPCVTAEIKAVE